MVWHSQTPDWFFKENFNDDGAWVSKEVMIKRLENYIKNLMQTLKDEYPEVEFSRMGRSQQSFFRARNNA